MYWTNTALENSLDVSACNTIIRGWPTANIVISVHTKFRFKVGNTRFHNGKKGEIHATTLKVSDCETHSLLLYDYSGGFRGGRAGRAPPLKFAKQMLYNVN